jgi:outer membrane protein assembly factor BamB
MLCVNWKEAKVAWTFADERHTQSIRSSPAVNDSIAVYGSRSKRVYALDPKTGKELWTFPTKQRVDSSPVIVGGRAFVGSYDGRLYALNLSDGKKQWEYETGGGFTGSPAVADQRLVIANDDGVVYCFGSKAD